MKIVVIGGGKVGSNICRELSDGCDIVLIDNEPTVINDIFESYDVQGIVGNGVSVDVQVEAGMANADLALAVTNSDEQNIMACIIAKRLGVRHTIARVRSPEYHQNVDFIKSAFGIDKMINPEEEAAKVIKKVLSFPMALNIETFADNKVSMVEIEVKTDSVLNNMDLKTFREYFGGNVLVCIVERNDDVFIPRGDNVLLEGDRIHVTGSTYELEQLYPKINQRKTPIRSLLIVGGGRIGYYLIKKLVKKNIKIKLLEYKKSVADNISQQFPSITVINDDGSAQSVLEEEGIADYDACVALTGIDEENIFISLFAKRKGVKKCITKVNRRAMLKILDNVDLDTIITPELIIADEIIRFARSLKAGGNSNIEHLYKLSDGRVESLEFIVSSLDKAIIGVPISKLKIMDNTIVSLIVRVDEPILPSGDDTIMLNDKVLICTTHSDIMSLEDILKN